MKINRQRTGLTDKNGVKISKGDIIRAKGYLFFVAFGKCGGVENNPNHGYVGFYLEAADEATRKAKSYGLRDDIYYYLEEAEVIGNIYDNPELLEEETG